MVQVGVKTLRHIGLTRVLERFMHKAKISSFQLTTETTKVVKLERCKNPMSYLPQTYHSNQSAAR